MEVRPLLDASYYFLNQELSDVTIVVTEDPAAAADTAGPPAKRPRTARHDSQQPGSTSRSSHVAELHLPGHRVILCSASSVCRTQASRWTDASPQQLELLVPPGQLQIGKLLIKCMYTPRHDLSNCSQQQLLQLLQLADKYDAPAALHEAGQQLAGIPSSELEWETVQAVYSLPPACPDMEPFKPLISAAAEKVQEELGDLELVWASESLSSKLLELPFLGLKQLLSSDDTRVVTENTVAATVVLWYKHQQQMRKPPVEHQRKESSQSAEHAGQQYEQQIEQQQQEQQDDGVLKQQLLELARLVRMQHCTQLYVATTLFGYDFFADCFTREQQLAASVVAGRSNGNETVRKALLKVCSRMDKALRDAWGAVCRPMSSMRCGVMNAVVGLPVLQNGLQECLDTKHQVELKKFASCIWSGRSICFGLIATCESGEGSQQSAHCRIRGYLEFSDEPGHSCAIGHFLMTIRAAPGSGGREIRKESKEARLTSIRAKIYDVFEVGIIANWLTMERVLRAKHLVHPDGCLHISIQLGTLE